MTMEFPEFVISLGASIVLLVVLLCGAVGLTIFFYHATIPPLAKRTKVILISVRALALAFLLFLIFEPLLKIVFHHEQNPRLAVLVDISESMTIKDRGSERSNEVRSLLKRNLFSGIAGVDVLYFRFASQLKPSTPFPADPLTFTGETTDLAAALTQLAQEKTRENIQAAVLISDGNYTVGKNPLSSAEELNIPLYIIGIGDTVEKRDVLIANVATNTIAYADTRVPVEVRVRSSGYKNERVEVVLLQGATAVDRKILQLQEGTRDYAISLSYQPKEEGVEKYGVSVSHLPGELTEKNNASSFFVRVLKTKLNILLVAGAPSPDVSVVRQILSEEQRFTVKALVQKATGEFYEGSPVPPAIDSADCLVFIGYPSSSATQGVMRQLYDAMSLQKKPLLFVGARTLDFSKLQMFETLLPFSWNVSTTDELLVFAEVAEKNRAHVLVNLEGSANVDGWRQLPPIFKSETIFHAKPEADVLAFARPDPGLARKIQSVALTEPLVLTRNVARQKAFAITGHAVWRWRLLAQGNPQTERLFALLLVNGVRWLTTLDEGKKIRVSPTKNVFTTAEPVEFTGEVYDDQFRAVDNAELRVQVTSKDQRFETMLRSVGSGRYEGSIDGLGAGDYGFSARAGVDERALGEDQGKFSVGQINVEFLETRMNRELLEQLAFHTGGVYTDITHASMLIDTIRTRTEFSAKELTDSTELELWNWQFIAALIVLLFATEWFVRKGSGML